MFSSPVMLSNILKNLSFIAYAADSYFSFCILL